ncbi:hypothetical protein [Fundicoccus culcitae]|uniref:Protein-export chaperone SecB n=1 Tax=Fundicoccus culcitae TaxID=2969821 RepID=A0ABY5P946_9LACT|nr:hypothetical protein [Fundicoccus culcitae]UUX35194.1 protein-export chaperone SecB [Fundicoccus culcitae]
MAVITFENYEVLEMQYSENTHYNEEINNGNVSLENKFQFEFSLNDEENKALVTIIASIGDVTSETQPFYVAVTLQGKFSYDVEEDTNGEGFIAYLKSNAVAIMFPYLRQIISTLTSMANNYPAYIMPTINIAKFLETENH